MKTSGWYKKARRYSDDEIAGGRDLAQDAWEKQVDEQVIEEYNEYIQDPDNPQMTLKEFDRQFRYEIGSSLHDDLEYQDEMDRGDYGPFR